MHRSKIEYCDDTWNPITGCLESCDYCYARKRAVRFTGDIRRNKNSPRYRKGEILQVLEDPFMADTGGILNYPFGFEPTYHQYRLNYPKLRKNGCTILVGEAGETFGDWVPDSVIEEIFAACQKRDIHKYLFLTRNPKRYDALFAAGRLPTERNFWYGTTVTSNLDWIPVEIIPANTFLNIEPYLEKIELPGDRKITDWIIIGAETGSRRGKIEPKKEWIEEIVRYADQAGIPVFMKNSLSHIVGEKNMRREIPMELTQKEVSPLVKALRESDCAVCKVHGQKKDMIALAARSKRGEMPKQLCHVCKKCFLKFCNQHDIDIPELEGLKDEKEKLSQNRK